MKKIITSCVVLVLLSACGEDGTIIDRMGRAAANTALNNAFNPDDTAANTAKDSYNSTDNTSAAAFAPEIANNLGVLDALQDVCGDNALTGTGTAATAYDTLAGYLSNDQLIVNGASGDCTGVSTNYLAVEAAALTAGTLTKCGGRTPLDDAVDVSYTVLAGGGTAISDGVGPDDQTHSLTTFPFLAAPAR